MAEGERAALPSAWTADSARRLRGRDLFYLVQLPLIAFVAWFIPERWWDAVCRRFVSLAGRLRIGRHMRAVDSISRLVGGSDGRPDARAFVPVLAACSHRSRLHIMRCYRPPEWQPELAVVGMEHLEHALRAGRGAILWVAPLVFSDLLTKMAFHRAGFQVTHLSRNGHGFSPTHFGVRFLNPIWTHIEDRYLAERLVMSPAQSSGALRALVQRVRRNQVVSVTVGGQGARAPAVPFLNGTLHIADAVPALAMRTGAALLPVFTVRQPDGRFATTVAPELRARVAGEAGVHDLVVQEAALFEFWVLRYPDQFVVWETVQLNAPAAGDASAAND